MSETLKAMLESQRAELERCKATLHSSRDEVTGRALSRLLTILLERSVAKLLTATDIGEIRALQSEANLCQKLLDMQNKPPVNLNLNANNS